MASPESRRRSHAPRPGDAARLPAAVKNVTSLHFLLLTVAGWMNRRQLAAIEYLQEENRVLLEQLGGRCPRLTNAQRKRLALKGKVLGRRGLGEFACIVRPDTILAWYRKLVAAKYDGSTKRARAEVSKRDAVRELVLRFARENPTWGYTRIVGALHNVGHEIGRNTVKRILQAAGVPPAPERSKGMSWSAFLRIHWDAIAAADFFTVEALTLHGLVRYHVFFVIELKTRLVHIAGIAHEPGEPWMLQIARNLLDAVDGALLGRTHLIVDRDPLYTARFRGMLEQAGVVPVRLPAKSPNLNAYAERFVRSARRECLSRLVPLGEGHLRRVVYEFVAHYNAERNHQGLGNRLLSTPLSPANDNGSVRRKTRLAGLLSYYHREAA